MQYYLSKKIDASFDEAVERVKGELGKEGFGVLTEIDVAETLGKKLRVRFRPYRILGACNPYLAHEALLSEDKIGTMLPCNVVVQAGKDGKVEVAAINPKASMAAVDNPLLETIADNAGRKLEKVIEAL